MTRVSTYLSDALFGFQRTAGEYPVIRPLSRLLLDQQVQRPAQTPIQTFRILLLIRLSRPPQASSLVQARLARKFRATALFLNELLQQPLGLGGAVTDKDFIVPALLGVGVVFANVASCNATARGLELAPVLEGGRVALVVEVLREGEDEALVEPALVEIVCGFEWIGVGCY
jgi:hypothetical protein